VISQVSQTIFTPWLKVETLVLVPTQRTNMGIKKVERKAILWPS
jgi:hypothetical protein